RLAFHLVLALEEGNGIRQGHPGAGNGGRPGAAIRLDYIAVNMDGIFADGQKIYRRAQRATDQALDLHRSACLLAPRCLAVHTGAGGARQHAVLGRQPALTLATKKTGYAALNAGSANHFGIAELNQYRAFGVLGVMTGEADVAQLISLTAAGALHNLFL